MTKWEYTTIRKSRFTTTDSRLEYYGLEGWEAYAVDKENYYLKRPLRSKDNDQP